MTAIVKGHGADTDGEEVFLPDGVTVRMYTAQNVDLDTDVALLALLDGAGDPGVPMSGTVTNYTVYAQDDQFIAQWYALVGDGGDRIWWVGSDIPDGTRLCEDPNRGSDDPEAVTCAGLGAHTCSGVLGLLQGESDIAIVACRGSWVKGAVPGGKTATSYDKTVEGIDALVAEYLQKLRSGDEGEVAQAEVDADSIPQDVVALMIVTVSYADWQKARWLKEYATQNDYQQLFGQLTSNTDSLAGIMGWLDTIPSYGAALDTAANAYPETFGQWFDQAPAEVRDALLARPAVASAHEAATLAGAAALFDEGNP